MSWSKMLSYIPEPVANSPQAQPWGNQAREAVNANQSELHAFLSQRVDLASHAGTATGRELERFEHCLEIAPAPPRSVPRRPLLRPSPPFPASPSSEPKHYPWLRAVGANSLPWLEDLQAVLPTLRAFRPYARPPEGHPPAQ